MKKHPHLPFLSMARWYDLEPELAETQDHAVGPNDWLVLFGPGGIPESHVWTSEQDAIDGALDFMLSQRPDLVEKYIGLATEASDVELLVRLVDARARFEARRQARQEFSDALEAAGRAAVAMESALRPFMGTKQYGLCSFRT